jgi:hypothetical protein
MQTYTAALKHDMVNVIAASPSLFISYLKIIEIKLNLILG